MSFNPPCFAQSIDLILTSRWTQTANYMLKKVLSLVSCEKRKACWQLSIMFLMAWICDEWHIARFRLCKQQPWNSASGACFLLCACTPAPEEVMEAVVSYACPRLSLILILWNLRTFMIFSAIHWPVILSRNRKSNKTWCFLGFTWKFLSISRKRKQADSIPLPWEITSSAMTKIWATLQAILIKIPNLISSNF